MVNAFSDMMKQLGTWVSNWWSCCHHITLKWRGKVRLYDIFLFGISPETKCDRSLKRTAIWLGFIWVRFKLQVFRVHFVFKIENKFRSVFQNPQKLNLYLLRKWQPENFLPGKHPFRTNNKKPQHSDCMRYLEKDKIFH